MRISNKVVGGRGYERMFYNGRGRMDPRTIDAAIDHWLKARRGREEQEVDEYVCARAKYWGKRR